MELPLSLQTAIEQEMEQRSTKKLAVLAMEISEGYRSGVPFNKGRYIRSEEDVLAYVSYRLPATYAAAYSAINRTRERFPDWSPKTMLDVGAGPGTAMWAVSATWDGLEGITLLERDENMIAFGKRLSQYSPDTSIRQARWIKTNITKEWDMSPHDLVIASYVLNELPQVKREAFIQQLWEKARDLLIIIEPGTQTGFQRIYQAKKQLLALGAKMVAPCPHERPCPLPEDDWCHFSQRLARTKLHRTVKGGELAYEDEKFSFLSMARTRKGTAIPGLVIRHPQIRKGHIALRLCTPDGIKNTVVTRKDKGNFRKARELRWGSVLRV
ncbi:MAG: small ribosomal subunit Rsm22 family protein [Clostridia bacterium]